MRVPIIFCSILLASASISACAKNPDKMQATYISTVQYQDYSCQQLQIEQTRTEPRIAELYDALKGRAKRDKIVTGVGIVVAWPALFFIKGKDKARVREYNRLRGELKAIKEVSAKKGC